MPSPKPLLLLLLGLALLASCSLLPEQPRQPAPTVDPAYVDSSWLTGSPCEPPCWNGLELDHSRPEDVYALARSSPYYDETRIEDRDPCGIIYVDPAAQEPLQDPAGRCLWLRCEGVVDQGCAMLSFRDGLLVSTLLSPLNPPNLQEVVERYGDPAYFMVTPGQRSTVCQAHLLWPERQMVVISTETSPQACRQQVAPTAAEGQLPATLRVSEVMFHQPGLIDYTETQIFLGLR